MMRTIKFRGLQAFGTKKGRMLFGGIVFNAAVDDNDGYVCAITGSHGNIYVDPETVGQYTGLKDKNGVEIYEDDLTKNEYGRVGRVVWHAPSASFDTEFVSDDNYNYDPAIDHSFVEVIGNIHSNPELLK